MTVVRHPDDPEPSVALRALDLKGLTLGQAQAVFEGTATETEARFELPSELRNDIARVEIVGENAAGAVQLIDDSWRRRTVGLISGQSADLAQPLLSPLYYLQRALSPFSDIRVPREADLAVSIPALLDQGVSVLVLADVGRLPDTIVRELGEWISGGGILVRFAGPRMAGGTDDLIPVALRKGDRSLGGSLSWKQPQRLADFPAESPFAGLKVPAEVTVSRQVLAEPTSDLPDRTWATLEDGTPLVTAAPKGRGTIVLFHVTGRILLVQPAAVRRVRGHAAPDPRGLERCPPGLADRRCRRCRTKRPAAVAPARRLRAVFGPAAGSDAGHPV
jgi:hypothetical protein